MKLIPFLLVASLIIPALPCQAEDCLVSTDMRPLLSKAPELQEEKINTKDGRYSALLKNGDILVAQFATCDLGIQAHYFSVTNLNDQQLKQRVHMLLSSVLPSDTVAGKVLPQLDSLSVEALKQPQIFQGLNDEHQIHIQPSPSPAFHTLISYDWIPPQH